MWRYNTYIDWAVFPRPVIPACFHFIDGKAPLGRAADLDLKVAVRGHSQTTSSLLACCKAWCYRAWKSVLDVSWTRISKAINSRIALLIGLGTGTVDEVVK